MYGRILIRTDGSGQYYGERLLRVLLSHGYNEQCHLAATRPVPVVAAGGVAECRKYRECPVCPGLRRCLHVWPGRLAPAAVCRHCSTAAGQHPHFQSTRHTAQTQGSHFYPQLPELSRRRRREYNLEFAELLLYFADKKNIKALKSVSSGAPEPDTRQHSHINRRGSGEQPWRSSWPPPSTQHQPPAVQHCIEEYPFQNHLFTSISNWYVHCPLHIH